MLNAGEAVDLVASAELLNDREVTHGADFSALEELVGLGAKLLSQRLIHKDENRLSGLEAVSVGVIVAARVSLDRPSL